MTRRQCYGMLAVLAIAVCLSSVLGAIADEQATEEAIMINNIYWCIHPYCWSTDDGPPKGYDPELWHATFAWELRVHELHMEFVSNMKPDEALIIYPSGACEPISNLLQHAQKTLGRRCIILGTRWLQYPGFLQGDR